MGLFGKPSPAKFAKIVTRHMRRHGHTGAIEYDEDSFALKTDIGVHYLTNMYAEHCAASRSERRVILDGFVTSFLEAGDDLPESLDEARANLLPKIRERVVLESLKLRGPPARPRAS
jgi:hypothetical protein